MKTNYKSIQVKQFVLSSFAIGALVVGMSVSNSLDKEYMAKVVEYEQSVQEVADAQQKLEDENKDDLEVGMVKR
jgi:hypothetical protein